MSENEQVQGDAAQEASDIRVAGEVPQQAPVMSNRLASMLQDMAISGLMSVAEPPDRPLPLQMVRGAFSAALTGLPNPMFSSICLTVLETIDHTDVMAFHEYENAMKLARIAADMILQNCQNGQGEGDGDGEGNGPTMESMSESYGGGASSSGDGGSDGSGDDDDNPDGGGGPGGSPGGSGVDASTELDLEAMLQSLREALERSM